MRLRLFFLPNFPGTTFIQGSTFIPDSSVGEYITMNFRHFPLSCNLFWQSGNFWTVLDHPDHCAELEVFKYFLKEKVLLLFWSKSGGWGAIAPPFPTALEQRQSRLSPVVQQPWPICHCSSSFDQPNTIHSFIVVILFYAHSSFELCV